MGGSDQWGNIVSGVDLVRRTDGRQVFGLTAPLITTASGAKMGKTAKGAVWLTAERLSPFDYWQFWRNTEDADVGRFLRLFTDLPLEEIARLEALGGAEINEAKNGWRLRRRPSRMAPKPPRRRPRPRVSPSRRARRPRLPSVTLPEAELAAGVPAFALFVSAGLAASNGEARRLIRGGGARLNDVAISDEGLVISAADLRDGALKLSAGRKQHRLVRVGD